ncbi:GAF domain-containing protein [Sphingomonas nostoxanthinifaciens]|uniref:GAF domain-containing protein n=1 Tax=Sphingomonas nostoxanthinifaciens TaxID=2872652 RepID=UPI001CC202F1|nr:GAF domain-containing protein [Sphingomonas nostoxanthinifaciens]
MQYEDVTAEQSPPWDESERLEALVQSGILDTEPEQAFEDVVLLAKTICDVPIALVSLVDAERQWFKARIGVDVRETPITTSVCAIAIRGAGLFEVRDLSIDPRTADMALVCGDPGIRFYAGMPLVTGGGMPLGSLCVIDVVPRPEGLTGPQRDALAALARRTIAQIELGALFRQREIALSASQGIGTWDWDVQRDRVVADERFASIYGVDPAVAINGAPIAEFFGRVHPDDLERLKREIDAVLRSGEPFSSEYRLVRADGSPQWLIAQGRPMLDGDGRPVRFPGISFDITDRKSVEARAAALLELSDRIRDAKEPGDIAGVACEIIGKTMGVSRVGYGTIDRAAELVRMERDWNAPGIQSLPDVMEFRDYGSYIDQLKKGETVTIADVHDDARTRDTAEMLIGVAAHSFINMPLTEQGGFVALLYLNNAVPRHWRPEEVAFVREVAERVRSATERRRVEQELAALTASLEAQVEARTHDMMRMEEQLRHSQKMEAVGQLTGGLAHDFNNMLTGISGALEMIQIRVKQGRTGELDRYAVAAQGAAARAAALTHRLLAFSRRQTLDPRPTDINRLVVGMEEIVRRTIGPQITLEVVGAVGLWPAIVDQNQLESALLNLCINARDAMPDGGRLTIETANKWLDERAARERDLPPGQYLSLCVTDTGTGMSIETQARAFDPFFTTKPLGEGTGLGLSMIYGFVRQSGGQVRIYSEIGQGTTMCLYFPRHYGTADREDERRSVGDLPRADAGHTVLIVDDEPTIRMLVTEVLEELGCIALEAGDGPEALTMLQGHPEIDLLITDVGLPGTMNGRQVADAARAQRPELKVLFITGYAENAVIGNAQLEPGMEVLTKPFAMELLAARTRAMLDGER